MASAPPPLPTAPPPWTCKCSAYLLPFYVSASAPFPIHIAYAPLEAASPTFSSASHAGAHHGGLAFAQILRYTDTPVGSYDELALLPGTFASSPSGLKGIQNGGKTVRAGGRKNLRITGIWVSSEASLVNGRRNWNIPKHIARFAFTPVPGAGEGVTKVEVFAAAAAAADAEGGRDKVARPFFTAVIHRIPYTPRVPFDSDWMGYLGFSTNLLQPPLPEGERAGLEVGTGDWKRSAPRMWCRKARFVWFDMRQSGQRGGDGMGGKGTGVGDDEVHGEGGGVISREHREEEGWENWWPGMGRWHLGLECQDMTLMLGEPEVLIPAES